MRDNGDFIKELRAEILNAQGRRAAYTKQKLTFLVGLISIGSISLTKINSSLLLSIIPVVAFIFDLWILGENFGIRRAGLFIRMSPYAPEEEKLWEEIVTGNRDLFARIAGQLSSLIILLLAAYILHGITKHHLLFWIWAGGTFVSILTIWIIDYKRNNTLKKIENSIIRRRTLE